MALKNMSLSLMSLSDSYRPSKKEVEKRICPHCKHTLGPGEIHSHNDTKKFTYGSGTYCMSLKLH